MSYLACHNRYDLERAPDRGARLFIFLNDEILTKSNSI